MADYGLIISIIINIIAFVVGIIIVVVRYGMGESQTRQDIEQNLPRVYNFRSNKGEMRGFMEWVRIAEPEPVGEGFIIKMKPVDIKAVHGELPIEKRNLVVEEFVERNRYFPLGRALGTEREKELIFSSNISEMPDKLKETPLGNLAIQFIMRIDSQDEIIHFYERQIQEISESIEQLHITDPLQEEKLRRLKSITMEQPRAGFRIDTKKEPEFP
jgi:hypothetical protein